MTNRTDIALGDAEAVEGDDLSGVIGLGQARAVERPGETVAAKWRGVGMRVTLGHIHASGKRLKKLLPFRFQCPPMEQIEFVFQYNHVEYDTVAAGQMSRRQGRLLTTVSFETLVVEAFHRFVVGRGMYDYKDSNKALKTINNLGRPVHLMMAHEWPQTEFEMDCTIRQLNIIEKAGEPDARYYNMSFSEWREAEVDRKHRGADAGDGEWPKHIKLGKGDTLQGLATQYWGRPSEAQYLGKVNGIGGWGARTPIVNSDSFDVGSKFLIPEPPEPKNGGVEAPISAAAGRH